MEKQQHIEFLRFIATLGVLCNHIPLVADHVFKSTATIFDDIFTNSIVHIVHWAVPVFVMITGALLLDKQRDISFEKAIKKYFWRMAVILLTIGWGFAIMEEFTNTHTINFSLFSTSFYNVLLGKTWTHMWYLYMLMGLYLVIPFIKPAINSLSLKSIDCMLVIMLIFTCILPTLTHFTGFNIGIKYPISSFYLMYLILGWRLTQLEENSWLLKNRKWGIILTLILSILLIVCCHFEFTKGFESLKFLESYNSPIEVALGILIFSIALSYKDHFNRFLQLKSIHLINRNSFGIYVFHMLWINIIYKVIKFNPLQYNPAIYIVLLIVILLLSILTTEIFRKIPFIGKYI